MTSAQMKPRSKSPWMAPAACSETFTCQVLQPRSRHDLHMTCQLARVLSAGNGRAHGPYWSPCIPTRRHCLATVWQHAHKHVVQKRHSVS